MQVNGLKNQAIKPYDQFMTKRGKLPPPEQEETGMFADHLHLEDYATDGHAFEIALALREHGDHLTPSELLEIMGAIVREARTGARFFESIGDPR